MLRVGIIEIWPIVDFTKSKVAHYYHIWYPSKRLFCFAWKGYSIFGLGLF